MLEISLAPLSKALDSLKRGYKDHPSELERDGIIQRFEYTLDLCWKSAQKVMLHNGIEVDCPKNVMRELGGLNWIHCPETWINYLEKRNEARNMYDEDTAGNIFLVVKSFIKDANDLLKTLESKI
jgi:nucleotidyltransferase substrate binding protein (TIGR01987 family)